MAIVLFLFGSILGLFGAFMQMTLGLGGFGTAVQTYFLLSIGLPTVTLLASAMRQRSS